MNLHPLNALDHIKKQLKHQIRIRINNRKQILYTRLRKEQRANRLISFEAENKDAENLFEEVLPKDSIQASDISEHQIRDLGLE